ncbi:MAG: acyl-CoA thioesterase [Pseudomonadota bacterium]|nr:acyl-CoA thioesterase [Pseudomonadota bacterium]
MPAPRPPFLHTHVVRFAEVDPAGILFFSRVAEHCHAAYEALVAAAGISVPAYFGGSAWKAPIVRWEVDYHAPSRLGEALTIQIDDVTRGRSSLTMTFRVIGPDGTPRSTARMVAVFVEGEPLKARAIPDEVSVAFDRLLGE